MLRDLSLADGIGAKPASSIPLSSFKDAIGDQVLISVTSVKK